MAKRKNFSDLTQDDLDRQDQARSNRSFRAAWTRKLEKEKARRDAQNDHDRWLVLHEFVNRDVWAEGVTVTYRKEYRAESLRLSQ